MISRRSVGERLVMSRAEPRVAGGAGEAFERHVQQVLRSGVMSVEILADGRQFPATHVENVFARNQVVFEPREISRSDDVTVKYHTWLEPRTSLEGLGGQPMIEGSGVSSVAREHPKRDRA